MKVVLKPEWDVPVQIPRKKQFEQIGHFVGRKAELAVFVNELLRRKQGAILVTGYRGVGKTSFVYQALHKLLRQHDNEKRLFVLVNGNHLDSDIYSRSPDPKSILVNLIRRLYASTQEEKLKPELKQDIESLYKKAVSSEFKLSEAIENNKKISQEMEISRQTEITAQQLNGTQVIWLVSFALALTTQIFPVIPNLVWLNKILPLLLAFPIPLLLSFVWKARKNTTTSEASSASAQQLYTMDNSVNNLEFDLEKLHNELRKEGVKTIYVLDELDKLDVDYIFSAMKYFKNLFTLSSALFVFVGGEELFLKYQFQDRPNYYGNTAPDYRPLEYTYFSSKYFLARPSDVDLLDFMDEITDNFDEIKSDFAFEDFKRSLIFDAKGDFFDLIQVIKGKITAFDDIKPILTYELNANAKLKADLQRAASAMFNTKYASFLPANWLENENVIRRLYYEAESLLAASPGQKVSTKLSDNSTYRSLNTNSVLPDYASDDYYRLLHRVGLLEFSTKNERGIDEYIRGLKVERNVSNHLSSLSELEEQLVAKIEKIYRIILNYLNFYRALQRVHLVPYADFKKNPQNYDAYRMNAWGRDARNTLLEFEPIHKSLTDLQSIKLDDIKKFTDDADNAISRLMFQPYDFLSNIFVDALKGVPMEVANLSQKPDLLTPLSKDPNDKSMLGKNFVVELLSYGTDYEGKSILLRKKRDIFKVPNQLVLSQDFKYPIIFLPDTEYDQQTGSPEQSDQTIIGCITDNHSIDY
ncbi:MAG TPA: AAA family ATPase [Anaerolineales bacterium]|nr:AAA family ATPase [Anaerolineales bacterium]